MRTKHILRRKYQPLVDFDILNQATPPPGFYLLRDMNLNLSNGTKVAWFESQHEDHVWYFGVLEGPGDMGSERIIATVPSPRNSAAWYVSRHGLYIAERQDMPWPPEVDYGEVARDKLQSLRWAKVIEREVERDQS